MDHRAVGKPLHYIFFAFVALWAPKRVTTSLCAMFVYATIAYDWLAATKEIHELGGKVLDGSDWNICIDL